MSISGVSEPRAKSSIDELIDQSINASQQSLKSAFASIDARVGQGILSESEADMMKVQTEQQNQMQLVSLLTNILRNAHEMAMTVIRNLRLA